MSFNAEKLQKFKEKHAAAQTGGKGSVRRKKKVVRKSAAQDDKRLKATLQRLNCRDIPGIEEVNLFKEDGSVIHFTNPKVQASIAANTYVVSGNSEVKKVQDMLPGIMSQLGTENLDDIKKMYAAYAAQAKAKAAAGGAADAGGDSDEDVPDLVDNDFEEAAKKKGAKAGAAEAEDEDEEDEEDENDK